MTSQQALLPQLLPSPLFRYVRSWLNPRALGREGRVSPTPGGEKPDQPDHPPTPSRVFARRKK